MPKRPETIKDRTERRKGFIRKLLAEGRYMYEILDACNSHPAFKKLSSEPGEKGKRSAHRRGVKPKTPRVGNDKIRQLVYQVKKEIKANELDGMAEIRSAHERLTRVVQVAFETGDIGAVVKAQKEINRMLGLHQPINTDVLNVDELMSQLEMMQNSVPTEDRSDE